MSITLSHGYFIYEDAKEQKILKPYPPLGILYLSAWLEQHTIEHEVFDTTFSSMQNFKSHLDTTRPQILALYTNLMTKLNIIEIIQYAKSNSPESIIILGGPDVRHNVEGYLNAGSDIIVIGEGEQTLLEVIQSIQNGITDQFGHIDGIAYKSGGDIILTPDRKSLKSIDELPVPNRSKIDMKPYLETWKNAHGKSAMTVSTQRGCPYTCKWCSTAVYGQSYRRRSPSLVAEEMKQLKDQYNPDTIWFVDDVFTVSHKWLSAFKEAVIEQDAIIPYECITRADRMNEDVINQLKDSGCFRVWIGAESGSQRVIDLMDRRVDVNYVNEMIKLTKSNGLEAGTFIMLGYPGETEEDIIETVEYLKDCQPDHFTITIAYPIKGTTMYNEIEAIQTKALDWMESTDRDRDFDRTYSRKYYEYALRWVDNEVRWNKSFIANNYLNVETAKYLLKSIYFRNRMRYAKS